MICLLQLPLKLTKAEVLIVCSRYVDADSERYSHKNMLQNYAANLHKGIHPRVFTHKLNVILFPLRN